jgi:hypothetical protein
MFAAGGRVGFGVGAANVLANGFLGLRCEGGSVEWSRWVGRAAACGVVHAGVDRCRGVAASARGAAGQAARRKPDQLVTVYGSHIRAVKGGPKPKHHVIIDGTGIPWPRRRPAATAVLSGADVRQRVAARAVA